MNDRHQDWSFLQSLALIFFAAPVTVALLETDGAGHHLGRAGNLLLVALLGAAGGFLMAREARVAGVAGGAVAGACSFLCLVWYLSGRETVWKLELACVLIVSALPGLGLYWFVKGLLPPSERVRDGRRLGVGWECSRCGHSNRCSLQVCERCGLQIG